MSHCPSGIQLPQPEAVFKWVLPLGLDSQGMAPGRTCQVSTPPKGLSPLWSWVCFIGEKKKRWEGKLRGGVAQKPGVNPDVRLPLPPEYPGCQHPKIACVCGHMDQGGG